MQTNNEVHVFGFHTVIIRPLLIDFEWRESEKAPPPPPPAPSPPLLPVLTPRALHFAVCNSSRHLHRARASRKLRFSRCRCVSKTSRKHPPFRDSTEFRDTRQARGVKTFKKFGPMHRVGDSLNHFSFVRMRRFGSLATHCLPLPLRPSGLLPCPRPAAHRGSAPLKPNVPGPWQCRLRRRRRRQRERRRGRRPSHHINTATGLLQLPWDRTPEIRDSAWHDSDKGLGQG